MLPEYRTLSTHVIRGPLVTAIVAVLVAVVTACGLVSDGTESFKPPAAPVVSKASCGLPDIIDRLDVGSLRSGTNRQGEGSVPRGFTPTSVISCEVSDGRDGGTNIDEVTLAGDIADLVKALSRESERTDKNTSVSCAYATYAPAAIWLVSPAGAVRAAWPTVVCDLRDDPLAPLEALTETGRTTVHTLGVRPPAPGVLPASTCTGQMGTAFQTTKSGAGGGTQPRAKRLPTLRLPEWPVAGLTACTYRISLLPTGDVEPALVGQVKLSAMQSTRLMQNVLAAPDADPCDRDASEVIDVTLFRPDGSGGGSLSAEADGCRRVIVNGLTCYRTATGEVTSLLRGES